MLNAKKSQVPFLANLKKNPFEAALDAKSYRLHFVLFFLLLFLFRLFLIDRGLYGFPDEKRYLSSLDAAFKILNGNFAGACTDLSTTQGRPGDAVLRLIPALMQMELQNWFNLPTSDLASMFIPQFFDVIISVLISLVFYKMARLLFKQQSAFFAFFCTVVFSLLTNSNIYVRHILPYDTSLLIFLTALYLTLKITGFELGRSAENPDKLKVVRPKRAWFLLIGFLVGLGYTVYPGYYFFPVIIFAMLVFDGSKPFISLSKILNILCVGLAVIIVFVIFEEIAQVGGTSYIAVSMLLSGTIDQGTFEEGFIYLPQYLLQVDTFIGILLLALAVIFLGHTLYRLVRFRTAGSISRLEILALLVLAGYLIHATESAVFHKIVFYGRLLHLYMPFMVLAGAGALLLIANKKFQKYALAVTLLVSIVSFLQFAIAYLPLAYPDSVLQNQKINTAAYGAIYQQNETAPCYDEKSLAKSGGSNARQLTLVNFCFFFPVTPTYTPFKPAPNLKLLYSQQHYLTFPAYTFEEYKVEEREILHNRQYRVEVYESAPNP